MENIKLYFRKGSGREILFEQISAGQNTKTNRKVKSARKFGSSGSFHNPDEIVSTLTQSMGTGGNNVPMTIGAKTGLYAIYRGRPNMPYEKGHRTLRYEKYDKDCPALTQNCAAGDQMNMVAIPNSNGNVHSLDANYWKGSNNPNKSRRSQIAVPVLTPDRENKRQNGRRFKTDGEPSFTVTGQDRHGVFDGMRIRRLTPTECERLMGLEDCWTSKGIIDGKEVDISDTQRYKMCGNGVVVNCVDYIYSLLFNETNMEMEAEKREGQLSLIEDSHG